jgi:hypothetical protein
LHSIFIYRLYNLAFKISRLDADLFLIKHLLILKEQIGAFDIEFIRPETEIDFSGVMGQWRDFSKWDPSLSLIHLHCEKSAASCCGGEHVGCERELDGNYELQLMLFTNSNVESIAAVLLGKESWKVPSRKLLRRRHASGKLQRTCCPRYNRKRKSTLVMQEQLTSSQRCHGMISLRPNLFRENVLEEYEKFFNEVEERH